MSTGIFTGTWNAAKIGILSRLRIFAIPSKERF
jgi:hypothetical protein